MSKFTGWGIITTLSSKCLVGGGRAGKTTKSYFREKKLVGPASLCSPILGVAGYSSCARVFVEKKWIFA